MYLVDKEIKDWIENYNLIENYRMENIFNIGYDLIADKFTNHPNKSSNYFQLLPGESVFVQSKEILHMPNELAAMVRLRNSRIRQGLSLEAPIYQPGHNTPVFFRITNISNAAISLNQGDGLASVFFEKLSGIPNKQYEGTFQNEFNYSGMGHYTQEYSNEMQKIEKKITDIKDIEKSIYGNVITLMTIFIGIFSLVNINLTVAGSSDLEMSNVLIYNLCAIGGIATLSGIIRVLIPDLGKKPLLKHYWIFPSVCFALAIILTFL